MRSRRRRAVRTWLALLSSAALAGGCADRIWPSDVGVRAGSWGDEEDQIGNFARTRLQSDKEWKYNHPDRREGEPGLCVALSGGGLRSASFAIGVLGGFHTHEQAVLREVDRVSSVSGGGYALSWYLVHHYDAWNPEAEYDASGFEKSLFESSSCTGEEGCGAYQRQLEDGLDILTNPLETGRLDVSTGQWLTALTLSVPAAFANLFANGLFGWHVNMAPMQAFYQARIERVFHEPLGGLRFFDLGRRKVVRFRDLRRMLTRTKDSKESHLPFPIIVTAANLNHTGGPAALHVANRLFELTPEWMGSDAFGYHDKKLVDLHTAVAVSGAALDSDVALSGPPSLAASALNMDLGYHVDNPRFTGHPLGYRATPFPAYFFLGWQNDLDGFRIHLTDGGHAENLAAFPLFRRLCRQTLIVDGTYDPNLRFEDYRVLRESLRGELDLRLRIPAIDHWVEPQLAAARVIRALKKEGARDLNYRKRVVEDLIFLHPAWDQKIRAAYEKDEVEEGTLKQLLHDLEDAIERFLRNDLQKAKRWEGVRDFDDLTPDMAWLLLDSETTEKWGPVLRAGPLQGKLHGLKRPATSDTETEEPAAPLDVLYLKLNLPRSVRLDPGGCKGEEWGCAACSYRRKRERDFPQEKTEDLYFDGDQFRSYRSLGTAMAGKLCLDEEEVEGSWFNPGAAGWSYKPLHPCAAAERPPAPACEGDQLEGVSP